MRTTSLSLIALALLTNSAITPAGETTLITEGNQIFFTANFRSDQPVISEDGRYVAFTSRASDLVAGDTNNRKDIFVRNLQTGVTERVSVDSTGAQANSSSAWAAISANGRYVTFQSRASNLVIGDTNNNWDTFVHDRDTGTTERVSVDSGGSQGNDQSRFPAISSDGRYVAFESRANNLVAGDTNGLDDIFLHDRDTRTTERVSVDSSGAQANGHSARPAISANGRYVTFRSDARNLVASDTNASRDIFVHDRDTGTTERVSIDGAGIQGVSNSNGPAISADGRYVAFDSVATNLVAGDTNGKQDVFVHDRQSGTTERVSVDSVGAQANGHSADPTISPDGRYLTFRSDASNLVVGDTNTFADTFVHDRNTGTTERVNVDSAGAEANGSRFFRFPVSAISADGRYVTFDSLASNLVSGDANGNPDVFVHDRVTSLTITVSAAINEPWANGGSNTFPGRTAKFGGVDGRYVTFYSGASNLVASTCTSPPTASCDTNGTQDVFVHDRDMDVTERVSVDSAGFQGNGSSRVPAISADGRYVTFGSEASNLVAGDTNNTWDYFVHDRNTGTTERINVDSAGVQSNTSLHGEPSISGDGRYVTYPSNANNLVAGDTNAATDIFVRDRLMSTTERVSVDSTGVEANSGSDRPTISADGRYVTFHSNANNLVAGDTNSAADVFVHDRDTGTTERVSVDSAGLQGNVSSTFPSISADGRYVTFESTATSLVDGDTNTARDIFVHDRLMGTTVRVSVDSAGAQANGSSFGSAISSGGRHITFSSSATNLVAGDTNGRNDIFVHSLQTGITERVSVDSAGVQGNDSSQWPAISANGRSVLFWSSATNLDPLKATPRFGVVYVHDRGPLDDEAPIASNVLAIPNPVAFDTAITLTASVDDSITGGSKIDSASYSIDGSPGVAMVPQDGAFDQITEDVSAVIPAFGSAGVSTICVSGTDAAGNTGTQECLLLAVYDPSAGFVTGGGWIDSPPGAYTADPALTGKANFGFFAKYKKGATVPDGNTEFQFKAGNLNFHSSSYEFLVVTMGGSNAQFKGSGTINGGLAPNGTPFRFMIWARDSYPDTFRIRLWYEDTSEALVYDNGFNQAIGGGSIVIHTKGQ